MSNLMPGSGLYVGQAGVTVNHHFVMSVHRPMYEFVAGEYTVEVFARLVGKTLPTRLSRITLDLEDRHAAALHAGAGVLFELQPERGTYVGHINERH